MSNTSSVEPEQKNNEVPKDEIRVSSRPTSAKPLLAVRAFIRAIFEPMQIVYSTLFDNDVHRIISSAGLKEIEKLKKLNNEN